MACSFEHRLGLVIIIFVIIYIILHQFFDEVLARVVFMA